MITEKEYLEAKETIVVYEKQLDLDTKKRYKDQHNRLSSCGKGDYVTFLGGSKNIEQ